MQVKAKEMCLDAQGNRRRAGDEFDWPFDKIPSWLTPMETKNEEAEAQGQEAQPEVLKKKPGRPFRK